MQRAFPPWDAVFAHAVAAASLNLEFAFKSYGEAEADRSSAPGSQHGYNMHVVLRAQAQYGAV